VRDVNPLWIILNRIVELRTAHGQRHNRIAPRATFPFGVRIAVQNTLLNLPLETIPFFAWLLVLHRRLL